MKSSHMKNYHKQFPDVEMPDEKAIRFHLKAIFKPDTTTKDFDLYKAGQGISAWSPNAVAAFGLASRLIDEYDRSTDLQSGRHTAHTDNGVAEVDFIQRMRFVTEKMFGRNPFFHGIADQRKFDASQGEPTQFLEQYYLMKLGISYLFVESYFSLRRAYKLHFSAGGTANVKFTKTSGEPMTLGGNGRVAKVTTNWVFRGDGPSIFIYKGDDVDKMQMNIHVDEARRAELLEHTDLDPIFLVKSEGEFCGLTITRQGLFPNIKRKLDKLIAQRFRDYKHFCQYAQTIRDNEDLINRIGVNETIAATSANTDIPPEEVVAMYATYLSFGHLSEQQFYEVFESHEEGDSIPRPDDYMPLRINMENI